MEPRDPLDEGTGDKERAECEVVRDPRFSAAFPSRPRLYKVGAQSSWTSDRFWQPPSVTIEERGYASTQPR
jgi:hypothetical protein